jgi:hypothetical protein
VDLIESRPWGENQINILSVVLFSDSISLVAVEAADERDVLVNWRRIATRYDRLARNYLSALALVAIACFWAT